VDTGLKVRYLHDKIPDLGGMCGASGEKSLGRKDRLSETKRLGPKTSLWFPWTFGLSGA
jgi:hypothetical protein